MTEFEAAVKRKPNNVKENSERQLDELRNKIRNAFENIGSGVDQMEDRIRELEGRNLGITQEEERIEILKMKAVYNNSLTTLEIAPQDNKYARRRREGEGTESTPNKILYEKN